MEKMSKTKKYTIFKTNNLDFNTVSFCIIYTNGAFGADVPQKKN